MTLRLRLSWMVLALLLPSAGFFAWIVVATYHRETESAQRQLRETARALSLVVDRELDKRAAIARTLAGSPAIAAGDLRAFYEQARAASPIAAPRALPRLPRATPATDARPARRPWASVRVMM